jgi:cytidyltransferase-like protein
MEDKVVLVSGCFDLLHAGHIAFLKTAAQFGRLHVSVGSDSNLLLLKGKAPHFSQDERLYLIRSIRYVEDAFIATGSGMLDFEPDMRRIRPDIFIVNSDGHTSDKETLCKELGVEYKVLERIPDKGLPARASSTIKKELQFPYRICITGGWLDQPWVSKIHPGNVIVAQVFPTIEFNDRSGLGTSSRKLALEIWKNGFPAGDPLRNARILFGAENPPGSQYVSGSQDHIGLLNPGVSRLFYKGEYWPAHVESIRDKDISDWLSNVLHLVPLEPRWAGYDPLIEQVLTLDNVKALAGASEQCWKSILGKDVRGLGESLTKTLLAWKKLLPNTVPDQVLHHVEKKYWSKYPGATTSGSGGGYVIVASDEEVDGSLKIRVRM